MPDFDLIIFDNDGVLVDSEPLANEVLMALLLQSGIVVTVDDCMRKFVGGSLGRVRKIVADEYSTDLPPDFEDRYQDMLFDKFRRRLKPVPGVVDVVKAVTVQRCVCSSGTHARIRLALGLTGLLSAFEGRLFSSDDVARGKPEPDLFLLASRTLGVAPSRCAVVEDSPLGIAAANAAGMTSFGFAWRTAVERLKNASGGTFSDMTELPGLLKMDGTRGPERATKPAP